MNGEPAFDLDANERLPAQELRELQLSRMQDSFARAYPNNRSYRANFDDAGVRPDDVLDEREFKAADDKAAIEQANGWRRGGPAEVWNTHRRIRRWK